ncbi:hypothetical protein KFZ76_02495 [Methylovulum psychrotolerans]|uniref:hypothetical protein n=1 Tax=Methylovulum psychrotolerans TaxID=1704499 RepID=UPI001BFF200B|nr:hypothetical protein [Methylovulum psychrotolerans]MBT9096580.1 hypothetical protein [Methylovulum psychrotolerans]
MNQTNKMLMTDQLMVLPMACSARAAAYSSSVHKTGAEKSNGPVRIKEHSPAKMASGVLL